MSNLLRNSLYAAYRDSPAVLDMFDQIQFDKLSVQFNKELYSRITPDEQKVVEDMLASDLVKKYDTAVSASVLACTRAIADLLELVLAQNTSGRLN